MESIPANSLVTFKFTESFTESKYEIFEVENDIVQALMAEGGAEMLIKSYEPPAKRDFIQLIG
jgi:hypothetical protein